MDKLTTGISANVLLPLALVSFLACTFAGFAFNESRKADIAIQDAFTKSSGIMTYKITSENDTLVVMDRQLAAFSQEINYTTGFITERNGYNISISFIDGPTAKAQFCKIAGGVADALSDENIVDFPDRHKEIDVPDAIRTAEAFKQKHCQP